MTPFTSTAYPAAAEHDPLLTKHIPSAKIPAILRLLDHRSDVLELCNVDQCDLEVYFQVALIHRKNAVGNRQSTETAATFRSSGVSSIVSTQPDSRASLASDITDFSTASSSCARAIHGTSQQGDLRSSLPFHINGSPSASNLTTQIRPRNLLSKEKKYKCPSCAGRGANRRSDFLKHLRGYCARPEKRFKCLQCDVIEKEEADIQSHGLIHQHEYQSGFELPPKVAFGCPFCGSLQLSLEAYSQCVCKDQELNPLLQARPILRLRGLLQQECIKEMLALECRRRGLDPDAWTSMTWDDARITEFAERLEYGCDGNVVHRALGVRDVESFVYEMLEPARLEHSDKPVPPVKDYVEAQTRAILREDLNDVAEGIEQANKVPAQDFEPQMSDYVRLRSSDPSSSQTRNDIQKLTATALQGSRSVGPDLYPPWKQLQNKRPPSTSSSSLADSRSRSKRPAASQTETEHVPTATGSNNFPSEFMDSALYSFHQALAERRPVTPLSHEHTPLASDQLSAYPPLNDYVFHDDELKYFFDNEFNENYDLGGN